MRIAVSDAGEGIPPHLLERVAEPFFTTKPRGRGTGLGLAMAKGFAEQSGGGFATESEVGVGTTVTLWLPRADVEKPASAEAEPGSGRTSGGPALPTREPERRILLVDDEPLVRAVLAAELSGQGYSVVEAVGGPTALERLDAGEAFDLLVTDLAMPAVDGLGLIREARRRRPGLPALLLTGYAGDGAALAVGEAARGGAFALLRKPVSAGELADRVAALLMGGEAASQVDAASCPGA